MAGSKQWVINLIARRNPIFGAQLERIGLLRIVPGALAMYLLIPVYILRHVVVMIVLYNGIVCPLLGVERVRLRNYIIIDRHLIPGLSFTGRFHCIYCGYANGICVATGVLLTQLSAVSARSVSALQRAAAAIPYLLATLLSSISQLLVVTLYNGVMSPMLGLYRASFADAYSGMQANGFGEQFSVYGGAGKGALHFEHACAWLEANALEQVESQWCPIKHLPKPGAVYPEHHKFFIERCELCELKKVLVCEGSLSPRKPRY